MKTLADFRAVYPRWLHGAGAVSELDSGDFLADVAREPGPVL